VAEASSRSAVEPDDQQWSVVDDAVDRLEQLWKTSSCPDLAPLIPPPGDPLRHQILVELLKIDQEFRWQAGQQKLLEAYLTEWSELQQEQAVQAELLEAECLTRAAFGSLPSAEDLRRRFPALPDEVRERVLQAAEMGREAAAATSDFTSQSTPRNALRIRCPHCHNPVDLPLDTLLTDLTCSACGSHFSLVDQSQATRAAPLLSTMGRFELVERLGVGGFGTVWKARDKQLDRTVAVKIPRQTGMSVEETEKFFREARAAAQLRHPNIVSVHEVGRDGDSVYIVSDFVRGATLGEWLTGQQLTSREAAELCAKIADALHHAHEQGVVHRDLKPANIMIDADGQPHLMDFGLARREVGEVTVTLDGQVLGTPAYMSPEQAQGEGHTADRRSDVYSLGVILFQLLTGELPFRGVARMIMHQVINDEPPSPRKLRANIPKDLATITLKCMEKEPSRRYQTAHDVAAELRRFLAGKPIQARPVGRIEYAWRWCRRNRLVAALCCAVVFALAAGTATSMYYAVQAGTRAEDAERERLQAVDAKREAEGERARAIEAKAIADDARVRSERQAYQATIFAVWNDIKPKEGFVHKKPILGDQNRDIRIGNTGSVESRLRDMPVKFRGWEWGYLMSQCDRAEWTLDAGTGETTMLSASVDGERILSGAGTRLALWDRRTHKPIWERTFEKPDTHYQRNTACAFDPQGQFVVVIWGGRMQVYGTGEEGPLIYGSTSHDFSCIAIDPQGDKVYAGTEAGELAIFNTETWNVESLVKTGFEVRHVCLGKSGKYVAVAIVKQPRQRGAKD